MSSVAVLIVLGILGTVINFLLGFMQIKNFNINYIEMRKKGKVAIGRKRGYIQVGSIVMFLIDNDGIIVDCRKMQGVTVFARVKKFAGLEGKNLSNITKEDLSNYNKYTRAAVLDAVKNYNVFKGGGEIEEKDTRLFRGINKLSSRG